MVDYINLTNPLNLTAGSPDLIDGAMEETRNLLSLGTAKDFFDFLRYMVYIVTPGETTFEHMDDVPNYLTRYLAFIPLYIIPEIVIAMLQGKKIPGFGETLSSLLCILLLFLPLGVLGKIEINLYVWLYDNHHILDLPWNSPLTWFLCLFLNDLGFYFWHRASHEINLIWAFHQVHHTSQDFNLSIGIRLPAFNRYVAILFALPLALIIPPSVFYVHYQLEYLYNFWIHTSTVPSFGWLDYIINNPSTHRVHHGRNRYCIDKNYGGVLNIWDVLFGTFEKEKKDVKIYNGLVHPIKSFDPIYINMHHLRAIYRKARDLDGVGNKLAAVFYGPGWEPGKPRLGNIEDIPEVPEDISEYDTPVPLWLKFYLALHVVLSFFFYTRIAYMPSLNLSLLVAGYILFGVASMGYLLEVKSYSPKLEAARCVAYFLLELVLQQLLTGNPTVAYGLRFVFASSLLIWIGNQGLFHGDVRGSSKKVE